MRLPPIAAAGGGDLEQWVQIAGAIVILIPFAAAQLGRLDQYGVPYLVLNVVGSGTLGLAAAVGSQWGFLLLETVWCGVSAWSLLQVARGRAPGGAAG
jgi:hypothetical protein